MITENNEERFVKPGYIDLLNNPDYYHHIEATANKKQLRLDKKQLRLDNVDHSIINGVSSNKRKPIATVLHCMIGQSVKCWNEQHELVINTLLDEVLSLRTHKYARWPEA